VIVRIGWAQTPRGDIAATERPVRETLAAVNAM